MKREEALGWRQVGYGLAALAAVLVGCSSGAGVMTPGDAEVDQVETAGEAVPEVAPPDLEPEVAPEVQEAVVLPEVTETIAPQPGEPGASCGGPAECDSGYCILTADGKKCTTECTEECPFGWKCGPYKPALPDEVYVCSPPFMSLCRPCRVNADCATNGADLGDACVPLGAVGSFCGGSCGGGVACPEGYACQEAQDVTGGQGWQCLLTEGECPCLQWYVDEQAETDCFVENGHGTCEGTRACTASGLSDCSAAVPAAEACNGQDDDCDGETDEETSGTDCLIPSQFGNCPGKTQCSGGELTCEGEEAAPEICDGKDNDCDGAVDEGYPDTDEDGTADCLETDKDGDGVVDGKDNCPDAFNPGQQDNDLDTIGDPCDPDDDNDQAADALDCLPFDGDSHPGALEECDGKDNDCNALVDEGFADTDFDGWKDCVDDDDDADGAVDAQDCQPLDAAVHPGAAEECDGKDNDCDFLKDEGFPDTDGDLAADCVDPDVDGDGKENGVDNCPKAPNPDQADLDGDSLGDACDPDEDGDGIPNAVDNCLQVKNPLQGDIDKDLLGNECDEDMDGDGIPNAADNCVMVANPDQKDGDGDFVGDACEDDKDGDGTPDALDCQPADPAVHPGAAEACDGADNDCDGLLDEGFPDTDNDGLKDCADQDDDNDGAVDDADCAPLNAAIHPGKAEACNGLDDDCDGSVDQGLGQLACGKGTCFHTLPACVDGTKQTCDAFEGAALEACDGLDNDCNGLVDEGLGFAACGLGVCQHTIANCANGELQVCDPLAGASAEVCDGLDNDCDGKTDEGLGQLVCGAGVCKHTVPACVGGEEQACDPLQGAFPEACDGLDNDCDGQADEELGTVKCGKGVCYHTQPYCQNGKVLPCDPFLGANAEECDGLDNDCDGLVDEELGTTTCGLGQCQHTVPNCIGGEPQECNPLQNAMPEVCDGKDNDCNGQEDEGLGLETCGVGECAHTIEKCAGGKEQSCDPLEGAEAEACDGLDNDCDGQTDEELGDTTCGLGECLHAVANCAGGQPQACDPKEGAAAETCDGLDNDCDGPADEELGQTTCGLGTCAHTVESCVGGVPQACDPLQGAQAEACNGKDDDCDGKVDEDFSFTVVEVGCKYVDVKNTGTATLMSWAVKADGAAIASTSPAGGIAAGKTGRIDLAYILDGSLTVKVTSGCVSVDQAFSKQCSVRLGMANYGDLGNDAVAVERSVNELAGQFEQATGLGATTPKDAGSWCDLGYLPHFLNVDTEDLSQVDLIYFHNHGHFSFSEATQKKLCDFMAKGGVIVFDDCGGADFADLNAGCGIYVGLNGDTSGGASFLLSSDVYAFPFPLSTADFGPLATWTEGGQNSLSEGVKAVVQRGPSPFLSGKQVGLGWVAFVGGDWGCVLGPECQNGETVAHKLMMNFAWIATGRGKLIK